MEIATITSAIAIAFTGFDRVNSRYPCQSTSVCFQTVPAPLNENTQRSGQPGRANRRKYKRIRLWPVGTSLAPPRVVRLTALPDEHTTIAIRPADPAEPGATVTVPSKGLDLLAVERALIRFALDLHGGNRTHAAAFLRLSRSALLYRMQKYHLDLTPRRLPESEKQS